MVVGPGVAGQGQGGDGLAPGHRDKGALGQGHQGQETQQGEHGHWSQVASTDCSCIGCGCDAMVWSYLSSVSCWRVFILIKFITTNIQSVSCSVKVLLSWCNGSSSYYHDSR